MYLFVLFPRSVKHRLTAQINLKKNYSSKKRDNSYLENLINSDPLQTRKHYRFWLKYSAYVWQFHTWVFIRKTLYGTTPPKPLNEVWLKTRTFGSFSFSVAHSSKDTSCDISVIQLATCFFLSPVKHIESQSLTSQILRNRFLPSRSSNIKFQVISFALKKLLGLTYIHYWHYI